MTHNTENEKGYATQTSDRVVSIAKRKRAAVVPSDLIPALRERIPGEVRVRSVVQTAKANNASGLLVLELYAKEQFGDHERRIRELEAALYRRAA